MTVELGTLHFYAASQHLYEENWKMVEPCLSGEILGDYAPLNLSEFNDYDHLVHHLMQVAYGVSDKGFLMELPTWKG
jgi:hypothetical protein